MTCRPAPPPLDPATALTHRYVASREDFLRWTLTRPAVKYDQAADRCRHGSGPKHPACGQPAVAWLDRGRGRRRNWWAYCERHLFGRWIEDGRLMCWKLQEKVSPAETAPR